MTAPPQVVKKVLRRFTEDDENGRTWHLYHCGSCGEERKYLSHDAMIRSSIAHKKDHVGTVESIDPDKELLDNIFSRFQTEE